MVYTFRGGIHPGPHSDPGYKAATNTKPIELLPAPDQVILPVSMHIGAPASPIVKVGDIVDMGQPIAEAGGFVSAPVHATVSGKVIAVEPRLHPNGSKVLSIVIENDHEDRLHESVHPYDFDAMSNEERIELIRSAGMVGHGGATFPTHVKIQSGIGKVDTIIVNAAECEPYITSDHRLLLERPEEVIGGLKMLVKILGVSTAIIGIEENKADTFPKIEQLIAGDSTLKLYPLKCKYPQGAEKQLINACTGREVPSGKLPADAGCAVFNVDTVGAIYRRFVTGMPVVRRVVTVSGSAIVEPKNLECRIGTQLERLVDACGGFKEPPNKLLMGGPMMGIALTSDQLPILKQNNAILAFDEKEAKLYETTACIRCGRCVAACPMNLMPTKLERAAQKKDLEAMKELNINTCMECGCCAFSCPAGRRLVQSIRMGKAALKAATAKK